MRSLTRKSPKCALLPLLKQRDVAAAVWVTCRLREEEGGKLPDLTRQVRGMQSVRGKWEHPRPQAGDPGCCKKFHQLGSDEKWLYFIGDFPFSQSHEEPPGEMLLAELKMD